MDISELFLKNIFHFKGKQNKLDNLCLISIQKYLSLQYQYITSKVAS